MTRGYRTPARSACDMFIMHFSQDDAAECACRYVAKDGRRFNATSGRFGLSAIIQDHRSAHGATDFLEGKALAALNQAIRTHNAVVDPYPND